MVAYTRYMRNEGADVFFETNIGIVNTFQPMTTGCMQPALSSGSDVEIKQNTITLSSDKPVYAIREKGILQLEGLPEDIHTLSVSIAGKTDMDVPGGNDVLQWCKQVKPAHEHLSVNFIPEYEGPIVTGQFVALNETAIQDEKFDALLCIPGEQTRLFVGKRNQSEVSFYLTDVTGVSEIITTTIGALNPVSIDVQSPFIGRHPAQPTPCLSIDSTHLDELLKRSVAMQLALPIVKDAVYSPNTANTYFSLKPSRTFILEEYTQFTKMDELIVEYLLGVRFRMREGKRELIMAVIKGNEVLWITPLVLLDGIPIKDHELIYQYSPLLVERIDIYTNEYLFGGIKYEGILAFTTYKHNYPELKLDKTYRIIDYAGTQAHNRFSMPDYSDETIRRSRQPDFRHTLLWNTDVQTSGHSSIQIPFYTSDYTGDYQATIEGITKNGEPVYATVAFTVGTSFITNEKVERIDEERLCIVVDILNDFLDGRMPPPH